MGTKSKIELLEHLMIEHGDYLKRSAYLYLGDVQVSEDMVQETFIKFYQTMDRFNQKSSHRTYLYRILINNCKMYVRKNKHELKVNVYGNVQEFESQSLKGSYHQSESFENQIIEQQVFSEKILKLDYKSKEVVILYYYNQWSIEDISNTLNITKSSVKMRLQRARKKLEIDLRKEGYDE